MEGIGDRGVPKVRGVVVDVLSARVFQRYSSRSARKAVDNMTKVGQF